MIELTGALKEWLDKAIRLKQAGDNTMCGRYGADEKVNTWIRHHHRPCRRNREADPRQNACADTGVED